MLPSSYEFGVNNQSGGTLTDVTVTVTPWKFDANGAPEYGTPIARNATNIGDNTAAQIGAAITNTEYSGVHGVVEFTGGGSTTATFYMRVTGANQWTKVLASTTAPNNKDYDFWF